MRKIQLQCSTARSRKKSIDKEGWIFPEDDDDDGGIHALGDAEDAPGDQRGFFRR